jgi:O-antigen ligase
MQHATDESFSKRRGSLRLSRKLPNFIFVALLALIALVSIPYGSVEPWWRALFECLIFGLAAVALVEIYKSGDWELSHYAFLWPLLALALFAFIQTIPFGRVNSPAISESWARTISADPHGTGNWVAEMLALVLLAAMLLRYARSHGRFKALVYLVIAVAVASAIFGLLRQTMQHQLGFGLPYLRPGLGYAQFINKNHFAFLMEIGFGLALGLIVWRGLSRDRILIAIAVLLLLGGAIVLSNSRGGILSLLSELLIAAFLFSVISRVRDKSKGDAPRLSWLGKVRESRVLRAVLAVVFLVVLTIGIISIGGAPLATSLESLPSEIGAQTDKSRWGVRRWDIWPATLKLIKDYPVAGVGFGGYWMAITKYHNASGEMTPQEAHNDYLEFAAGGGLIGLALGAIFFYLLVRRVRKAVRTTDRFALAARCGAILGIGGVAVHSLVDFGLHVPANAVVFMVLIVISTIDLPSRPDGRKGAQRRSKINKIPY